MPKAPEKCVPATPAVLMHMKSLLCTVRNQSGWCRGKGQCLMKAMPTMQHHWRSCYSLPEPRGWLWYPHPAYVTGSAEAARLELTFISALSLPLPT